MKLAALFAKPLPDPVLERELARQKAQINYNAQVIQSGSRVIQTISDSLKMMAVEADAK